MRCKFKFRVQQLASSIMVFLAAVPMALASEPAATSPPDDATETLRERTIYVPFEALRNVFEKEGRGVFLPYEQFRELWRAAREARAVTPDDDPPVKALVTEALSEAEVTTDLVTVTSKIRIEVLTGGWHEIPLRLGDAAITSALIAGQPARIIDDGAGGHTLLIENTDDEPKTVELTLEYAKAFAKSPGRNSVSFQPPQAPVSRWRVRIPQSGVNVNIRPLIAATDVPNGNAQLGNPDETVLLAFVGAAPEVQIEWTPRTDGATGLEALVGVDSSLWVWVHEGVVRTRTILNYDVSRAPIAQLALDVPKDQKVVGVFAPNVRQWSVDTVEDAQRITVLLFEPVRAKQTVTVELERFGNNGDGADTDEFIVPVVRAVGANRQRGVLGVAAATGLRVEPVRREGLLQIDADEVPIPQTPGALPTSAVTLSYRYAALPYELALRVEKVRPLITLDTLVETVLTPESLSHTVLAVYTIERAGVFSLELNVPSEYTIQYVRGLVADGVQAAKIESYHSVDKSNGKTRLVVNLSRKALGRVGLTVSLHKRLKQPDLERPTGKATTLPIAFPRIATDAIERSAGRLVIYASESIRLNSATHDGLRTVSLSDAVKGMEAMSRRAGSSTYGGRRGSGVLSYIFADEPFALTLTAERRKPQVTARQLLVSTIDAGVVKYAASFVYDVKYSGVESLRIDVPEQIAARIQNRTTGVTEAPIDPQPDDVRDGYVAWRLHRNGDFTGEVTITLSWETKTEALVPGEAKTVSVPRLIPRDVDRAWGQIILAKAETIDIRAVGSDSSVPPVGLRPIDPHHDLMAGANAVIAACAARAFEFHGDWVLGVSVTRYEIEEIKRTSIERAFIRMVVTRGDQVSAQALYRVRSARQRFAIKLPSGVQFDGDPVRINNRSVPLERGKKDEFFVPLAGQVSDKPFLLDIRYTIPSGSLRFACPEFPAEPAAQKTYLGVYLPTETVLVGSLGPWTSEMTWRFDESRGFVADTRQSDWGLVSWVTQGNDAGSTAHAALQTDGRLHLFSTLRPLPPPKGELTLMAINHNLLSALIVFVVLGGGLLMLRFSALQRVVVVGAFLAALVLSGVFLPTFSRQIIGVALLGSTVTMMILWFVKYFAFTRPRDPDVIARRDARQKLRLARISAKLAVAVPLSMSGATTTQDAASKDIPSPGDHDDEGGKKNG